jgi:tripartite-type tricarboxylate transporter receptor subunit TctC
VRAGKLRALGLTSAKPNPLTPDVPPIAGTMPELKPFDVSTWFGVFLPAEEHRGGGRRLQCRDEGLARRSQDARALQHHGRLPGLRLAEEFGRFVDGQIALWKGVIDKEGLKLDVN